MALTIGMIGLGIMGRPMAKNILKAGHQMTVFDLRPEATAPLEALGARRAANLPSLAREVRVTLMSLPDARAVEAAKTAFPGWAATTPLARAPTTPARRPWRSAGGRGWGLVVRSHPSQPHGAHSRGGRSAHRGVHQQFTGRQRQGGARGAVHDGAPARQGLAAGPRDAQ